MSDTSTLQLKSFVSGPLRTDCARRANMLLLGCALFMALLAGQYYLKIRHAPTRSAFLRWSNQIEDLCRGINIWEVHEYPNPPIMALILVPFARLSTPFGLMAGALAWFVFKALLTMLAIHWVWRMLEDDRVTKDDKVTGRQGDKVTKDDKVTGRQDDKVTGRQGDKVTKEELVTLSPCHPITPSPCHPVTPSPCHPVTPSPSWAKLAGLLLALGPIEGDLTHGNVNLFILFLLTAGLYAFVRGQDAVAGLLLGGGIACKLTPLLFVPYFAWKRAWTTLACCLLSLVLCWGIIPGLAFGFQANADFFASWVDKMVVPYVIDGKVTSEHQNQSLPGLAHRLLTHSPSISERVGTEYFPREFHNLADLNPILVRWFLLLLMGGYVGLILWTCRTPLRQRRDWRLCAEFGLVMLGMLLFSERTWKHHCVILLLPGAVLGFRLASGPFRQTGLYWVVLCAAGLLMLSTSSGFLPGQARFADLAQVYGACTVALLLLAGALAVGSRRSEVGGRKSPTSDFRPPISDLRPLTWELCKHGQTNL